MPTKQNRKTDTKDLPYSVKVLLIGAVGGLLWSSIWYGAYFFNFTDVGPNLFWMAWSLGDWTEEKTGQWLAILMITIGSIAIAFLYRYSLAKISSMWMGIGFGAVLWVLIFYIANPLFVGLDSVQELSNITITSTICLFISYGLFVGYSIAYEEELQEYGGT